VTRGGDGVLKEEICRAIEQDFGRESSDYRSLYRLIEKGTKCIEEYQDNFPVGFHCNRCNENGESRRCLSCGFDCYEYIETAPTIDFFDSWTTVKSEEIEGEGGLIKEQMRRFTRDFLEDICDKILPQGRGEVSDSLRDERFVERRASGVIIHDESNAIPLSHHIGVRVVREVICQGISRPYLLIDGEISDYFVQETGTREESLETAERNKHYLANSIPSNKEIAERLNEAFLGYDMPKVIPSEEVSEMDEFSELCYVLFNEFEFQTAQNFNDILRHGLIYSEPNKGVEIFVDFLRDIGETAKNGKNISGENLLKHVNRAGLWKYEPLLKIIQDFASEFPEFVEYEDKAIEGSNFSVQTASFSRYEEGQKKTIEFRRKVWSGAFGFGVGDMPMTDTRFKAVPDPDRAEISRRMRISMENALSMKPIGGESGSSFIGGLYLGPEVRSKLLESFELTLDIARRAKNEAHQKTAFFELSTGAGKFGPRKYSFGGPVFGHNFVLSGWDTFRSPIESFNTLFDEEGV